MRRSSPPRPVAVGTLVGPLGAVYPMIQFSLSGRISLKPQMTPKFLSQLRSPAELKRIIHDSVPSFGAPYIKTPPSFAGTISIGWNERVNSRCQTFSPDEVSF